MLNNFIYAKKKSLFTKELEAGNVLNEAIVFIEDTKLIWNHGTYFDCNTSTFESTLDQYALKSDLDNYALKSSLSSYATLSSLANKVDKVSGKLLSTEDFTTSLKTKLEGINVYKQHYTKLSGIPTSNEDGWYSIANIQDTESSIVQLSTSGHSDVQLAISTGWSGNNTGSLTVLNSFINDVNSNFAFVKAVRIRKANSKLLLEAKINRTGYYANSSYVSVVVSIFTNAGHNPLVTNSTNALELVSDNSNVLQEFILQDKAIIAENIVAKTITAETLNVEGLQDLISNIQEITYNELVTLRNNSNLKTGKLYRITDYVTEAANGVTATGNTFDLIVEAISPNKLSSDAKAVPHALYRNPNHLGTAVLYSGNFYCIADGWKSWEYSNLPSKLKSLVSEELSVKRYAFNLSLINAGELKIKVTSRCHRNNSVNANKVYSIPILGFDLCPSGTSDSDSSLWDDNVIASDYHKYTTSVTGGTLKTPDQITDYEYILKVPENGNYKLCIAVDDSLDILTNSSNPLRSELCVFGEIFEWIPSNYFANLPIHLWELKYNLDNDNSKYIWIPRGNTAKGVIYYMKDEYGNEAPYDFKNILFDDYYTFSTIINRKIYDSTVITTTCTNNSILPVYNTEGQQLLNAIVFKNTNTASICQYNKFGFGCKNNKFGDSCSSNEFGDYCISNTFGNHCYYNNFSMYCQDNSFGNYCLSMNFGLASTSNKFGNYIIRLNVGKSVSNCSIKCPSNDVSNVLDVLKNACRAITFKDQCNNVTLYNTNYSEHPNYLQNIVVNNNLSGFIELDDELNTVYTKVISKNAAGEIILYIEGESQVPIVESTSDLSINAKQGSLAVVAPSTESYSLKNSNFRNTTSTPIPSLSIPSDLENRREEFKQLNNRVAYFTSKKSPDGIFNESDILAGISFTISDEEIYILGMSVTLVEGSDPDFEEFLIYTSDLSISELDRFNLYITSSELFFVGITNSNEDNPTITEPNSDVYILLNRLLFSHLLSETNLYIKDRNSWKLVSSYNSNLSSSNSTIEFINADKVIYKPGDFFLETLLNLDVDYVGLNVTNADLMMTATGYLAAIAWHQSTLKQDKLVSGVSIKTINGESLLGEGDIVIEGGVSGVSECIVKITYSNLKTLRDNAQLIPGIKYRITDYNTTTTQLNTQSSKHQFDVIVTALTNNTLSEDAKACLHEGGTYFEYNNLEAWEIKYCLDNDKYRFYWADDSEQTIIDSSNVNINLQLLNDNKFINTIYPDYYIYVDNQQLDISEYESKGDFFVEFGRETSPDGLENQLCIYKTTEEYEEEGSDYPDKFFYCGKEEIDGVIYDKWQKSELGNWFVGVNDFGNQPLLYVLTELITVGDISYSRSGKGVIYYMKDEYNNECPYDFKNIMFKFLDDFYYTFSHLTDYEVNDMSLTGKYLSNVIKESYEDSSLILNNNIFISTNEGYVLNYIVNGGLSNVNIELLDYTYYDRIYETRVARNSSGEIKIYCEADLIL